VRCSPEETPGSIYNLDAIRSGDLEFGIVQSDVAYAAYNGEGAYADKPFPELRSVLVLYPEYITILVREGSSIRKIADLAGRRVNVGRRGGGAIATWGAIETAFGWKNGQRLQITDLGPRAAAQALCAGKIDASVLVVGHPSGMVETHFAACPINFVAVSGPEIDALVAGAPYLRKGSIPGALYGRAGDTTTIGTSAVVMTTANENPEAVAAFAQSIIAEVSDLRTEHPVLANLTLEEITDGSLAVPFHPAAGQVYNEVGLLR
jgi:uncharacterized protein